MEEITITEALAEIATLKKRIASKRESIARYLARDARLRDPLEKEGGSVEFIKRETQSVTDLEQRVIHLRTAIQKINLKESLTVHGKKRQIAEWLTWRREIGPGRKMFLDQLIAGLDRIRKEVISKGMKMVQVSDGTEGEVIVSLEEGKLASDREEIETVLGELDGKLSLANATIKI